MALPKVMEYTKNVAKSVVYSSAEALKTDMPALSAYMTNEANRQITKSIYAGAKDYKNTIKKAKDYIVSNPFYEAGQDALKNAFEDIKTGKFYNKQRMDAADEMVAESMGWSMDDMDSDDLDFGTGDDGWGDITDGDKLVAASTQVASMKAADMVSQTTLKSADAIIKTTQASTRLIYNQNLEMIGSLKNIGYTTAQTQSSIINLTDTMKISIENSKTFYENTGKHMADISGMLKEMLEMQRNLYKANNEELEKRKQREAKKIRYDDIVGMEGELNIGAYAKNVGKNVKGAISQATGGMFDTLLSMGGGEMLKSFTSSPLSFMSTMLMQGLAPAGMRKGLKQLDKSISALIPTLIARFNAAAKNEDGTMFTKMLGSIFGIKNNIKSSMDTGNYKKGPVPFDGIVRHSIVDVIPSYLRRIEAALTGQQERVYNHETGKWTNMRAINEEWNNMKKASKRRATGDLVTEIRKVMANDKAMMGSKYDQDRFNDALEIIMDKIYETGYFKKNKDDALTMGIDGDTYELIANLITNADGKKNPMYKNQGMRNARMALAHNVNTARNDLDRRIRQMEENGDSIFQQLFNNSTDRSKLKIPKYEEAPLPMGGTMSLINQKDDLGHNVFYYLKNIYKELGIMRRSGGFGDGSGGGPGLFDTSVVDFIIPDEHKKTAKERYNESEEAANRRYAELVAKHTKKGGSLYDLSKDAKGNINLARATQQQMQILESLREQAESHGWINDIVYTDKTMLTKLNDQRSKSGGDLLDQAKFLDRMKATKNIKEKLVVMQDQVARLTKKPGEWTAKILKKGDEALYNLMFGAEAEDEDGNKVKGFLGLLQSKLNQTWDNINTAIEEKLINPLKKKLGVENMKQFLDKIGLGPIIDTFMNRMFGEKDSDGKRKGGIFGEIQNSTKDMFKKAGGFVKNSFQTVFDPITSRVKGAITNRRGVKQYTVNPDGTETEVESDDSDVTTAPPIKTKRDTPPRRATKDMYKTDPAKAFDIDKEFLHDQVNRYADQISFDSDPNTDLYLRYEFMDTINRLSQSPDKVFQLRSTWYKVIDPQIRNNMPIALKNAIDRAWDRMLEYANNREGGPKIILPHQVVNTRAKDKAVRRHMGQKAGGVDAPKPGRVGARANQMAKEFDRMFNFDRFDNGPGTQALSTILREMALNSNGDGMDVLNNMTVADLYNATYNNTDTAAFARFLSDRVKGQYNNRNVKVQDILNGRTINDIAGGSNPSGNGVIRLLSSLNDTLANILSKFERVSSGSAVRVVRVTPTNTTGFGSAVRGPRARSARTRSSRGTTSGGIDSSADGGYFEEDTISALSKGELYGQGGLFGKVPSTGLYNIKAGTTIIPTNKDKFVEKANEQSVISKIFGKAGIKMNADASNAQTRVIDGKVYTLGEDGKWHNYEKNVHTVVEDGFLDRIRDTASRGFKGIMRKFGREDIAEQSSIKNTNDAMDVIKKYAPKMTGGALLGAAVGLLAGNPLLGAAIGAGSSFVSISDKAKETLFGKELVNEDGTSDGREGGIISRDAQQWVKKHLPDMGAYGVVGGALGLFTPFGLVGGALIGSGIGLAKHSTRIQEALFGDGIDPRSGLISKNARDYVKKSAPNLALGAGAGLLLGPFGLVGNLALGAGVGLLSTTDDFKNAIFGEEVEVNGKKTRVGGLVGTLKIAVVDPLKTFANSIATNVEDFIVNDMINPLKDAVKPIFREIKLMSTSLFKTFIGLLTGTFNQAFGRPIYALFRDKLIMPIEKKVGSILGVAGGVAKGILGAPFHALGAIGNSLQMKHIRSGNAYDMTAEERLQFRKDHKIRGAISNVPLVGNLFGSLGFNPGGYRDNYKDIDTVLADMTEEQLKDVARDAEALSSSPRKLKYMRTASSREITSKLSQIFHVDSVKKIVKAMKSKNVKLVNQLILTAKPIKGTQVTPEQRSAMAQEVIEAMTNIDDIERRQNLAKWNSKDMFKKLHKAGLKGLNKGNIGKFARMAKTEYSAKHYANMNRKVDPEDPNASLLRNANDNTKVVVDTLNEGFESIKDILTVILPEGQKSKAMKLRSQEFFKRNSPYAYDKNAPTVTSPEGKKYIKCKDGKWRAFTTDPITGRMSVDDTGIVLGDWRTLAGASNNPDGDPDEEDPENAANAQSGKKRRGIKWIFDSGANHLRKFIKTKSGDYEEENGRTKQNADRKEAANEQKKIGFFGKLWHSLFGEKDKETGEKKEGWISKAFGGLKSLAGKFFGTLFKGAAIVTAVAGAGHFGLFFKNELWPKVKIWWADDAKPFLKEHFSNLYNGIVKVVNFVKELPSTIFNFGKDLFHWVSGTGDYKGNGFPRVFTDKILPWYVEGLAGFAEVYIPPIVKALFKVAPAIIKGIGKGIKMVITDWWNSRGNNRANPKFDPGYSDDGINLDGPYGSSKSSGLNAIKPVPGGKAWWKTPGESLNKAFNRMDNAINSIDGGSSSSNTKYTPNIYKGGGVLNRSESERAKIRDANQSILNNPSSSKAEKEKAMQEMIANAEEPGGLYNYNYMPTSKNGDLYDKNGNLSNSGASERFNPFDGVHSPLDRVYGYAIRTLLGNRGKGVSTGLKVGGKLLSRLGPITSLIPFIGPQLALSSTAGGIGARIGSKGLDAIDNVADRFIPDIGKWIFGDASTLGGALKIGGNYLANKFAGTKLGNIAGRIADSKFVNAGLNAQFKKSLLKAGKGTGSYYNHLTEEVVDVVVKEKKGILASLKSVLDAVCNKLFEPDGVVAKLAAKFRGCTTTELAIPVQEAGEKVKKSLLQKMGEKIKNLAGSALSAISGIITSIPLLKIAEITIDFISGVRNARDILGITEEVAVSIPEQVVAGLMRALNGSFMRGLVPEDMVVDIVVDVLAPIFSDNAFSDLKMRRKESAEILEKYEVETGLRLSVEEYNHRNSLFNKARRKIAGWMGIKTREEKYSDARKAGGEEAVEKLRKRDSGLFKTGLIGEFVYDAAAKKSKENGVDTSSGGFAGALTKKILNKKEKASKDMDAMVKDGDVEGIMSYEANTGDWGTDYAINANKMMASPFAISNQISMTADEMYRMTGKTMSYSEIATKLYEYADPVRHRSMDGFDKVGIINSDDLAAANHNANVRLMQNYIRNVIDPQRAMNAAANPLMSTYSTMYSSSGNYLTKPLGGVSMVSSNGVYGMGRAYQKDPSIANIPFNKSSDSIIQNVGNSGCGPIAAYNAVNYAYGRGGNDIESAVNLALDKYKERDGGTEPGFFDEYFRSNGLKSRRLNRSNILANVSRGNPVIMMGKDPMGGNTPYGPNPHYVTATGTDGRGNIIIDDPESMYGQARYPISKVLGKTSMAIGASRYGRSKWGMDSNAWENGAMKSNDQLGGMKASTTVNPFKAVRDRYTNYPGMESSSSSSSSINITDMIKSGSEALKLSAANGGGFESLKDKPKSTQYYTCFQFCRYKDKTFGWLKGYSPNEAETLTKYIEGAGIGGRNYSSMSISSIFSRLGFNLNTFFNIGNKFGPYLDISCKDLKNANASVWGTLMSYALVFGFHIGGADKDTLVGSITSSMGLKYKGEVIDQDFTNNSSTSSSSSDSGTDGLLYDSSLGGLEASTGVDTQSSGDSIFSMLGKLVRSLFSYTDKSTGEKKNLLDFFGFGGGTSSSSGGNATSIASSGASTLTGVQGDMANGFPYFSQCDPTWGNIGYGKSGTISSSGCGPTSMAMILKSFGASSITPKDTAAWSASHGYRIVGSGTSWDFFNAIGKEHGLTTSQRAENKDVIVDSLRKGYPIISSMKPGDFTKGGHFIVLSGIDSSGNVLVNDPSGSAGAKRSAIAWDPANITRQAKQIWIFNKNGVGSIKGVQSATGVTGGATMGGTTSLKGNSVAEQIWNYLKSKGYNDIAAAGIMGNIERECSYNPACVQKGASNPGFGIVQWTWPAYKEELVAKVPDWKTNLAGQLDFLWMQLNRDFSSKLLPQQMNACSSLAESTTLFHNVFERSADKTMDKRIGFAQKAYQTFAGRSSTGTSTMGLGKNPIATLIKNKYGMGGLPFYLGKQSKYGRAVVPGGIISSPFNDPTRRSHNGIDIAGPLGSPVFSPVAGVVYRVDDNSTNGKLVVVRQPDGKIHTFSHLKSINVTEGAKVSPGTLIGYLGNSGNSAGPHVHYSTTDENGQYIDPSGSGRSMITPPSAHGRGKRPIGGGEGFDYTVLIKTIIELLELMSKSSVETTSILKVISDKIGVDITDVDTSNSSKTYADIANKLRALDKASGGNNTTAPRSKQVETERLVNIMTAIARD